MTEVEFSQQLSQLEKTAKTLNQKSDSVNALIERFQSTLRQLNIGLEVWPATLDSEPWNEQGDEPDSEVRRGFVDTELGFVKVSERGWVLATRRAQYEWDYVPSGDLDDDGNEKAIPLLSPERAKFYSADDPTPLLEESRSIRIEALKHLSEIVEALKTEAEDAIKAIEAAEKFVSSHDRDKLTDADLEAPIAPVRRIRI